MDDVAFVDRQHVTMSQWLAVGICVVINILDGFEILAAGFTAPAIAAEFGLSLRMTGIFLSAAPTGMIVGALFLSPLADRYGRRRIVLACLAICAAGMATALVSNGLGTLLLARLLTGIGVGAMMVTINTVVAEVMSARFRDLALVLQATGFPLGGAISGLAATALVGGDWRWVYGIGGGVALALIPIVLAFLPAERQSGRRRAVPLSADASGHLFRLPSLMIAASFFLMMASFYFVSSWAPRLLSEAGPGRIALSGATLVSAGGVAGDLAFAALVLRWRAWTIAPIFAVAAFALTIALAASAATPGLIGAIAFALGFFLYGAMAGHYAVVPMIYPAAIRASGSGLAIGTGRIGAAIAPFVGGLILSLGASGLLAATIMAAPLLCCALLLPLMRRHVQERLSPAIG